MEEGLKEKVPADIGTTNRYRELKNRNLFREAISGKH
jgi:hypothetical protein